MRQRCGSRCCRSACSRASDRTHPPATRKDEGGWITLFDGKTLNGWHVSAKTGHSRTSKNKSGGRWVVEDGAIVGSQDMPGNGGIIITDKKYKNFEVELEMNNDFGPDSGLFLRSTEDGKAYQAMIDYHANGNLMGIYGEGIGGFHYRNYNFLKDVTEIKEDSKDEVPIPLPISPEEWPKLLEARRVERAEGPHRRQPAEGHDLDQGRQVHGVHRRQEAPRRRRRHRPASPRRRRLHQGVRALSQHPGADRWIEAAMRLSGGR